MASNSILGLPPVPLELKSISPFLQRAQELRKKDPVIAYWCLFHAAQLGLSLKPANTALLFSLLNYLENLKTEIGHCDQIDVESVAAAYVENFALKIFVAADDEDRSGNASRSTAKRFLASANFLQVLYVFPKSETSDSNEEKIKYAKWKAAEIAKAFREGRVPLPGPANAAPTPETEAPPLPPIVASVNYPPSPPTERAASPPQPEFHSLRTNAETVGAPDDVLMSATAEVPLSTQDYVEPASDLPDHLPTDLLPNLGLPQPYAPPNPPLTSPPNIDLHQSFAPPPRLPPTPPSNVNLPQSYEYQPVRQEQYLSPREPPREPALELTPTLISKTQKHCRFAISALEYEDVETARRELRNALSLLGG